MNGDTRQLIKAAERSGLKVVRSKRNSHLKVYDGSRLVAVLSSTPSSSSGLRNAKAELRRAGATV